MRMTCFAAAAAAVGLCLATPAAAVTFTFQVDVTSTSDGSAAPAAFYQDWTFTPAFSTSTMVIPGLPPIFPETVTVTDRFGGTATVGDDRAANPVLALTGLDDGDVVNPFATFKNRRSTQDGVPSSRNTEAEFNYTAGAGGQTAGADTPDDFSDDAYAGQNYSIYIFGALGNYSPPALDLANFVGFILAQGPLDYTERGSTYVSGPGGFVSNELVYTGKATLVKVDGAAVGGPAAVPEPATWAMMILGFGAAGAMLRRRSLAAA